jgi:hypothetical protein
MKIISAFEQERQAKINEIRLGRLRGSGKGRCAGMAVNKAEWEAPLKEADGVWRKRRYKKGEKTWHIKPDFLNWISYEAAFDAALVKSALFFDSRGRGTALRIPYRQLNMLPGNKYVLTVKYFTEGPAQPAERDGEILDLYPRLHIAAGKKFETFTGFFTDMYAEAFSSGDTPGQEVPAVIDFTGMKDSVPGVISIGTLQTVSWDYPGFSIDWIRVYNETAKKEVYFNDFDSGGYTAARDTEAEPGVSGDWVKAGADE